VLVHVPDPSRTHPARAKANFRLAATLSIVLAAIAWLVAVLNYALGVDPADLGVRPRTLEGLAGIVFAPLVHGDFAHLVANTPPLIVLGTVMLTLYPRSALRVLPAVYLLPGAAVWLLAQSGSSHVGASGLVYGLASHVFCAGLIRRDRRAIAAAMLVAFLYGALVWGLVPIRPRMSWETHLAAAIVGAAMALVFRELDPVPIKKYAWEGEPEEAADEDGWEDGTPQAPAEPSPERDELPPRLH
jgi:membrane associated rhomboid family serine protease